MASASSSSSFLSDEKYNNLYCKVGQQMVRLCDIEIMTSVNPFDDSFKLWNSPRPGKKMLVIDLDCTLCDFQSNRPIKITNSIARPYLHYFMTTIYKYFDIAIWSATKAETLQAKLEKLGLFNSEKFKISFSLSLSAMPIINIPNCGQKQVKYLQLIWNYFPSLDRTNTIIIDDQSNNFLLTPHNGIKVSPYFNQNYEHDAELLLLMAYLKKNHRARDVTALRLSRWRYT